VWFGALAVLMLLQAKATRVNQHIPNICCWSRYSIHVMNRYAAMQHGHMVLVHVVFVGMSCRDLSGSKACMCVTYCDIQLVGLNSVLGITFH
jgi:hypothetical protein